MANNLSSKVEEEMLVKDARPLRFHFRSFLLSQHTDTLYTRISYIYHPFDRVLLDMSVHSFLHSVSHSHLQIYFILNRRVYISSGT